MTVVGFPVFVTFVILMLVIGLNGHATVQPADGSIGSTVYQVMYQEQDRQEILTLLQG